MEFVFFGIDACLRFLGSHSCCCVTSARNTRGKVSGIIFIRSSIFSHTHEVWTLFYRFNTFTRTYCDGEQVESQFWFFLDKQDMVRFNWRLRLINWAIVLRLDTGRALRQVRGMRGMRAAAHYHTETERSFAVISKTLSSFEDLWVCVCHICAWAFHWSYRIICWCDSILL